MSKTASYVCGISDPPLIYQTIGDAIDQAVNRWPNRESVVVRHQSIRWSYQQLAEVVDGFAGGLLALNLEPGDRIGI